MTKEYKKSVTSKFFWQIYVPKTCNKIVVVKSDNIGRNNVVNIISIRKKKNLVPSS